MNKNYPPNVSRETQKKNIFKFYTLEYSYQHNVSRETLKQQNINVIFLNIIDYNYIII